MAASLKFRLGRSTEQVAPDSRARLRKGRLGYLSDEKTAHIGESILGILLPSPDSD
jgi:hypothetical protein